MRFRWWRCTALLLTAGLVCYLAMGPALHRESVDMEGTHRRFTAAVLVKREMDMLKASLSADDENGEDERIGFDIITAGVSTTVQPVNTDPEDNTRVHLLLLAYMRTGSSMTGRIMKLSKSEVFYWYEPLHMLERHYVTGGFPDRPYTNKSKVEEFTGSAVAKGNVSALLACDIEHVYQGALLDGFLKLGPWTGKFAPCFAQAAASSSPAAWAGCVRNMSALCRTRFPVTAIKTIRLTLARALEVMRDDRKVKVVHLFRDPRAVLLSRRRNGYTNWSDLGNGARAVCARMSRDLQATREAAQSPELRPRYVIARYEDVTYWPRQAVRRLYEYVGLRPSEEEVEIATNMILEAKKNQTSAQVAQAWRQNLTLEEARVIKNACYDVMEQLGYRLDFADESELKDLRVPSFGDPPAHIASLMLVQTPRPSV